MPAPGGVNANLFALLDDDDEDESGAPVQQKAPAKPAAEKPKEQTQKSEPRERKPKNDRKGGGKGRDNERTNEPYDGSDKPAKPSDSEGRGGKGRRRYEDGERKGKGKGSRRGRDYDRHSQTGRGKGETREGRGKFNWGEKTEGAPAEGTEASAVEGAAEADPENKATDEETPAPEPEEEENTMTFDEYMKAQSAKGHVGPVLNERKLDSKEKPEGFQATRDKGGKEDEMYGMIFADYDGKKGAREEKHERDGWVVADDVLNIKFADPNASSGKGDRGDRRGKGKGKGGGKGDSARSGGRGAPRNSRPQQQGKIELDDANAFPSLA